MVRTQTKRMYQKMFKSHIDNEKIKELSKIQKQRDCQINRKNGKEKSTTLNRVYIKKKSVSQETTSSVKAGYIFIIKIWSKVIVHTWHVKKINMFIFASDKLFNYLFLKQIRIMQCKVFFFLIPNASLITAVWEWSYRGLTFQDALAVPAPTSLILKSKPESVFQNRPN